MNFKLMTQLLGCLLTILATTSIAFSQSTTDQLDQLYTIFNSPQEVNKEEVEQILNTIKPAFEEKGETVYWLSVLGWEAYYHKNYTGNSSILRKNLKTINEQLATLEDKNNPYLDIAYWVKADYIKRRNAKAAKELSQKVIDLSKTEILNLRGQILLAYNHFYLSEFKETFALLDQAEIYINDHANNLLSPFLVEIGYIRLKIASLTNQVEQAEILANELISLNDQYHFYKEDGLAILYKELAQVYVTMKDVTKAIEYGQKALAAAEQYLGESHQNTAPFVSGLGDFYYYAGRYEESIPYQLRTINILQQYPHMAPYQGFPINSIVKAYLKLNQLDSAMVWSDKGVAVAKQYNIEELKIRLYSTKIKLYGETKDYENGLPFIQQVLVETMEHFDDMDISANPTQYHLSKWQRYQLTWLEIKATLLSYRAVANENKADFELALKTINQRLAINEEVRNQLKSSEQSLSFYNDVNNSLYSNALAISYQQYQLFPTANSLENMHAYMEKSRHTLLVDALQAEDEVLSPMEIQEQQAYRKNITELEIKCLAFKNQEDSLKQYRHALAGEKKAFIAFKDNLLKKYPKYAKNKYTTTPVTAQWLQDQMDDKSAFIQYTINQKDLYLYLITKEEQYITAVPIQDDFYKTIDELYNALQNRAIVQFHIRDKYIDASHELYKLLIAPISDKIATKTQLHIIPDDHLYYVPFETLLPTNDKKGFQELDYLIKKYAINYHYSATAYQKLQAKATPKDNSLLAFAPVFTKNEAVVSRERTAFITDSLYRAVNGEKFQGLPATATEVKSIKKQLKAKGTTTTDVFLYQDAQEEKLKALLSQNQYQFVHIATHSIANQEYPRQSAIILTQEGDQKDDGTFYASEIQLLDINADLVVLSSCESGMGKLLGGEGLIALNRSFVYAGTKNVLFSLWKVSDTYSSQLMIAFYKEYLTGKTYSEALRAAKLSMLTDRLSASPNYWAAFLLIGE